MPNWIYDKTSKKVVIAKLMLDRQKALNKVFLDKNSCSPLTNLVKPSFTRSKKWQNFDKISDKAIAETDYFLHNFFTSGAEYEGCILRPPEPYLFHRSRILDIVWKQMDILKIYLAFWKLGKLWSVFIFVLAEIRANKEFQLRSGWSNNSLFQENKLWLS